MNRPRFLIEPALKPEWGWHLFALDHAYPPCIHKSVQDSLACIVRSNQIFEFELEVRP